MSLLDWWWETRRAARTGDRSSRALRTTQLEPRILLNAAPVDAAATGEQVAVIDDPAELVAELTQSNAANETDSSRRELVLLDRRLPEVDELFALLEQTNEERTILWVDRNDSLEEVTQAINDVASEGDFDAIHVLSHGDTTGFSLGAERISTTSVDLFASTISFWSDVLTDDADILLYGCHIGETSAGQGLATDLARLTGADVAANTGLTGSPLFLADWTLDYSTGSIETTELAPTDWHHVLANIAVTSTNDIINGDTSSIANLLATDGGDGISLREAIEAANNTAGHDTITFNIGTGVQTLGLTSTLGTLNNLTIDATTQPGYSSTPLIVLDATGSFGDAISIGSDVTLTGVSVVNASGNGISINGSNNTLQGNWIGVDASGTAAGNAGYGIVADGPTGSNNLIGGTGVGEANRIERNAGGVLIQGGTGHTVRHNQILNNEALGNLTLAGDSRQGDYNDPDGGPNGLLNLPQIYRVIESGSDYHVTVFIQSIPNSSATIDLLTTELPTVGQSASVVGSAAVTANADGLVSHTFVVAKASLPPSTRGFTAQATTTQGSSGLSAVALTATAGVGDRPTIAVHESTEDSPDFRGRSRSSSRSLAVTPDGKQYVVWIEDDGANTTVYGRLFDVDGSPLESARQLNADPGRYSGATVDTDAEGQFVVMYIDENTGLAHFRVMASDGNFDLPTERTVEFDFHSGERDAFVEVLPTGEFVFTMSTQVFGSSRQMIARYDINGIWRSDSAALQLEQGSGNTPREGVLALGADGMITAAWVENDGIHVRQYDAFSHRVVGADTNVGGGNDVAITALADGRYFLAITDSSGPLPEIYGQFLDANGSVDGGRFRIDEAPSAPGVVSPVVTSDEQGRIAIAYHKENDRDAYYKVIDSAGATIVSETHVAADTDGEQHSVNLAFAPGTNTLWITYVGEYEPVENGEGIYKRAVYVPPAATNATPVVLLDDTQSIRRGDAASFDASESLDADGDSLAYKWDLDFDGIYGEAGEPTTDSPDVSWAELTAAGIDDAGSYTIGVEVSDGNGGVSYGVTRLDVTNVPVSAIADSDPAADQVAENSSVGTAVGVTAMATDTDPADSVTYSLDDDAGGRFSIDTMSGVVTVAGAIDYEANTSHSITVRATSTDGSFSTQSIAIAVTNIVELPTVTTTGSSLLYVQGDGKKLLDPGISTTAPETGTFDSALVSILSGFVSGEDTLHFSDQNGISGSYNAVSGVLTLSGTASVADYQTALRSIEYENSGAPPSAMPRSIEIEVNDGTSTNASARAVNVIALNSVSAISDVDASPDTVAEGAATGTAVGITANATDPDVLDTVSYSLDDDAGGRFSIDATTGVVKVASVLDYETAADHTITIRATSTDTSFSTQTFNIAVTDVNEAPAILGPAAVNVAENSAGATVIATYSATDQDAGDSPSFSIVETGLPFAINSTTGDLTVTGVLDFETTPVYALTIRADDGNGGVTDQAITVNVTDINEAPAISGPTTVHVAENTAGATVIATYSATDEDDGDSPSFSIVEAGLPFAINSTTGDLTVAGVLDYETTPVYALTIQADDGNGGVTDIAVNVNIADVNEAPAAVDDMLTVAEDDSDGGNLLTNDSDPDGDSLTTSLDTGPTNGTAIVNPDGSFTYTPDADYHGVDAFSYEVTDGAIARTATVYIVVTPVNDPPVAGNHAVVGNEDAPATGTLVGQVSDVDGDTLTFSLDTAATQGTATVASNGDILYTPNANYHGPDSFTYSVSDGTVTRTATVNVTVLPVNDEPVANNTNRSVAEDNTLNSSLAANASDVDGDSLTFSLNSAAANGSVLVAANGEFTYTPDADFFGADSFTYSVFDGTVTRSATVVVTVTPVDDPPQMSDRAASTTPSDPNGTLVTSMSVTDVDDVLDDLEFSIIAGTVDGAFSINDDGEIRVANSSALDPTRNSSWTLTVEAEDDDDAVATATVTITLLNSPPIAADDLAIVNEDGTVTIDVITNDTEPDGTPLTTSLKIDANHGTVVRNGDGTFQYTPDANYHGPDSFTYEISDGVLTAQATVSITVQSVNDRPIVAQSPLSIVENSPAGTVVGFVTATDPDGDPLTYEIVGGSGSELFAINASTGKITVAPSASLDHETRSSATLQVRVRDNSGLQEMVTIPVSITDVNERPLTAGNRNFEIASGSTLNVDSVNGLLAGSTDDDGDPLSIVLLSGPSDGVLSLNSDGSFSFTLGSNPVDTFFVATTDGTLQSDPVRVQITSQAIGPAPPLGPGGNSSAASQTNGPSAPGNGSPASDLNRPASTPEASSPGSSQPESLPPESDAVGDSTSPTNTPADPISTPNADAGPTANAEIITGLTPSSDDESLSPPPTTQPVDLDSERNAETLGVASQGDSMIDSYGDRATSDGDGTSSPTSSSSPNRSLLTSFWESVGFASTDTVNAEQWRAHIQSDAVLNSFDEIQDDVETNRIMRTSVGQVVTISGSVATVGYVAMAIRGGALVTGLLAQMPAWRIIDPLVVLDSLNDADSESLESMIDDHQTA